MPVGVPCHPIIFVADATLVLAEVLNYEPLVANATVSLRPLERIGQGGGGGEHEIEQGRFAAWGAIEILGEPEGEHIVAKNISCDIEHGDLRRCGDAGVRISNLVNGQTAPPQNGRGIYAIRDEA